MTGEAEELADGEGKIIGSIGDYMIVYKGNSIKWLLTKEETEARAEALNALAAALKKRGKTLGDLL